MARIEEGDAVPGAVVQVSMPTYGPINTQTVMAIMGQNHRLFQVRPKALERFDFVYWQESILPKARQGLLEKAFKLGASHILWIDADMVFPADTLERLLAHDLPVVGANCVRRQEPYTWTALDKDGNEINSHGKSGIQRVDRLGFGVTMMRLDCFTKIRPPFFNFEWIFEDEASGRGHYMGEDVYLFDKLRAVGIYPHIDHDLSREIKHVGSIAVDYNFTEGWREALPDGEILDDAVVR